MSCVAPSTASASSAASAASARFTTAARAGPVRDSAARRAASVSVDTTVTPAACNARRTAGCAPGVSHTSGLALLSAGSARALA